MYSMASYTLKWVQGLELDSNGKLVARPRGAELQQIREEQEEWGASSEKASHAFLENLAVTGAKAAGNAGLCIVNHKTERVREITFWHCLEMQAWVIVTTLGLYSMPFQKLALP